MMRERDIEIKKTLDMQMDEKLKRKINEKKENEKFISMIIVKDENDKKEDEHHKQVA